MWIFINRKIYWKREDIEQQQQIAFLVPRKHFSLSNGPDKKERPKRSEHVGMQKGASFTIVSTKVLIGLNIKFYEIFAKQHVY